jgi:hypothetical protein
MLSISYTYFYNRSYRHVAFRKQRFPRNVNLDQYKSISNMNKRTVEDLTNFPSKKRIITKITTVTTITTEEEDLETGNIIPQQVASFTSLTYHIQTNSISNEQLLSSQLSLILRQLTTPQPSLAIPPPVVTHSTPSQPTPKPVVDPYQPDNTKVPPSSILEKGHIYFFYRPKVNTTEVSSLNDVQKLYILTKRMGPGT